MLDCGFFLDLSVEVFTDTFFFLSSLKGLI